MLISELLITNEMMEQAIEKKWDQIGGCVKAFMAETHAELWRQVQLLIEKERLREHETCKIKAAEEEIVAPPLKKTRGRKLKKYLSIPSLRMLHRNLNQAHQKI